LSTLSSEKPLQQSSQAQKVNYCMLPVFQRNSTGTKD